MKCSLGVSNFLDKISSLSHSIVFLFLCTDHWGGLLISPCYSLELCIQICISYEWWLMNHGHFTQCEVVPHYSFDLHFYNDWWNEHIFRCLLVICMYCLEKCLIRSSSHFLVWLFCLLLSCMSCFYILEIKHLLVPLFANTFSLMWVFFSFGLWLPLWCKSL